MGGIMTDYKEGDKATVARSRAEAWQKRGIVSMETWVRHHPKGKEDILRGLRRAEG